MSHHEWRRGWLCYEGWSCGTCGRKSYCSSLQPAFLLGSVLRFWLALEAFHVHIAWSHAFLLLTFPAVPQLLSILEGWLSTRAHIHFSMQLATPNWRSFVIHDLQRPQLASVMSRIESSFSARYFAIWQAYRRYKLVILGTIWPSVCSSLSVFYSLR